jgi:uncharacterized membrane protein YccC
MGEKLGGALTIIIPIVALSLVSVLKPPVYIQILCGLIGSIICLVGVVFAFSEGRIRTKDRKLKMAVKAK